ncbi:MAG: hypothetical protein PHH84_07960, partial [Oscillospiraceae bacterium]|nr:hypothetical protein [Oscillospiraceae bacterium]
RYEYIDDDNYVPATDFVAGKETAIQVFFFEETPIDKIEDAQLEVYRNGAKIATLKDFKRDKDNNALNFMPNNKAQCENWKAGNYKFKALYKDTEFVLDNVKITKIPKLKILAVPLKANYSGVVKAPGNLWYYGHRFLRVVFPVAKDDIEWSIRPDVLDVSSYMYNLDSDTGMWKVSEQLKTLQSSSPESQYDVIVGFIAEGTNGYAGFTYRDLSIVVSESEPDMPATVAHEIGHLYNLGEEYNGGSYNTYVNMPPYGYSGVDWYDRSKPAGGTDKNIKVSGHGEGINISKDLHPFEVGSRGLLEDSMGFMGGSADLDYTWITPSVWKHLFNVFLLKSSKAPKKNEGENNIVLRPAGYITDSGEVTTEYPWRVTYAEDDSEAQTAAQTGEYEIQALGDTGTVLARQYFTPTSSPITYAGQSNESTKSDKYSLNNVSIPFPEGTVKFNILKDNQSVKEIPVSGNAPTITLTTQLDGGEFTGNETIEWEGNDPDGDKLYYTVEYSHNGAQWSVLQPDITDSQLDVDFSKLPGGDKAVIRVIASDGINSSKSDSNTFKVPNKPPVLFVDEANVSDEGVILNASAYDSADGWIYDDRLTFTSDKDGEIGKGSTLFLTTLSVGNHVVTITAENDYGQKAEKTIKFTVKKSKKNPSSGLPGVLGGLPAVNNLKDVIFWVIIAIGIILIFIIIIKILTKKKKCPKCGKKLKKKKSECPKCGYHFVGDTLPPEQPMAQEQPPQQPQQEQQQQNSDICRNCGKQNAPAAKFCAGCGNPFLDNNPPQNQDLQQEQPPPQPPQQEQSQQNNNICQHCGNQNAPAAKFCAGCGNKLNPGGI